MASGDHRPGGAFALLWRWVALFLLLSFLFGFFSPRRLPDYPEQSGAIIYGMIVVASCALAWFWLGWSKRRRT